MRLLLIRHGQTPSNVHHLLDTAEPGPGLTELGREQAAAVPAALAEERIGALYASNLVRTQITARPLAAALGLPVTVLPGLREVIAGDLEMRGDDESARTYVTTCFSWSRGDLDLRMPGGENGHEAFGRMDAAVAAMVATAPTHPGTVVAFSHGAIIRSWCGARGDNISVDYAAHHPLSNTGIVVLEGDPVTGWQVLLWEGTAVGGEELTDTSADGPAADEIVVGN